MNFVNSFVNLEKIPNNILNEKTERRIPLCLGPWLDYNNLDSYSIYLFFFLSFYNLVSEILKEGVPSVVILQNILIDNDKFFANSAMKNLVSFNALFLTPLNLKIKVN